MWRIPGFVIGLYFIVRAVAEPFVIDFGDPSTYRHDWGGPHLAGVLAVHMGPGVLAAALMIWWLTHRRPTRAHTYTSPHQPTPPHQGAGPDSTPKA